MTFHDEPARPPPFERHVLTFPPLSFPTAPPSARLKVRKRANSRTRTLLRPDLSPDRGVPPRHSLCLISRISSFFAHGPDADVVRSRRSPIPSTHLFSFPTTGEPKGKKSKEGKIGKDGKKKRGRGKGKDVVDPNKPKGPKGAYMCFVQIARPKINASNPGMKFADIAKTLGEQWKGMDATTRGGYEKMAEADKERYQREIAAYVPMSEAGLEQLRKEKAAKKSAGGLQKPYKCSSALTKFLGGDKTISRANLTSKMWSYFKEKNLMDPENKRWIIADKNLSDLLGVDRFQGFTVSKYLSPHLLPMEQ